MQRYIYLGNSARKSNLDQIIVPEGMCSHLPIFVKNCSPAIFFSHLEFLRKMQKCNLDQIFDPKVTHRVICKVFKEIAVPPFFRGHLEFLLQIQKHMYLKSDVR